MHRLAHITNDQPYSSRRSAAITAVGIGRLASTLIGGDPIRRLALCLTVTGWSLVWARGLSLTDLYPAWLAACLFALGLALIPLHREEASGPTDAPRVSDRGKP